MTSTLTRKRAVRERSPRVTSATYTALAALAMIAIVLQGLWAGLFLSHSHSGTDWIEIHARGGEVALALTAVATLVAFVRLRQRRELWLGGAVLAALLVLEAYLGGLIHDDGKDALTAVHVPLAMAIMGLAAWLVVRSRRPHPARVVAEAYPSESTHHVSTEAVDLRQ